jgi:3' exoribonuclease, RNase T-like
MIVSFQLPKPIAVIDTETLSLAQNAVIYEFGMIVTDTLPIPGSANWQKHDIASLADCVKARGGIFEYVRLHPSLVPQLANGQVQDEETLAFHKKLDPNFVVPYPNETPPSLVRTVVSEMLTHHGVEEIWANHPQFDFTRLQNMWGTHPWKYNQEYDVATARKIYKNSLHPEATDYSKFEKLEGVVHTAIGDCLWNLHIIGLAYQ